MEHTGFPSDETLAAFIDGRLDAETRSKVVEHMADCTECRDTYFSVAEIKRLDLSSGVESNLHQHSQRRRWYAGLAAAAVLGGVFLLGSLDGRSRQFSIIRGDSNALIRAANGLSYRRIDSRLSDEYVHKERLPITRGQDSAQHKSDLLVLKSAANSLEQRALASPSVQNLLDHGSAALLIGDYQESRDALEQALRKQTGNSDVVAGLRVCRNVDLLNALSSLYSTTSEAQPTDTLLAVESSTRAWSLAHTPTTAWNRAVALEEMHVPNAQNAWIDYLKMDASSAWGQEAMRRLRALRPKAADWPTGRVLIDRAASQRDQSTMRAITSRFPQESRVHAEDEMLRLWVQEFQSGSKEADDALSSMGGLGNALRDFNGDSLAADVAAIIHAAGSRTQTSIASAASTYLRALRMHSTQDSARAADEFANASAEFRRMGIPLCLRADVLRATSLHYSGESQKALEILGAVEEELASTQQAQRYASISGQVYWLRGLIRLSEGRYIEALRDYERAASLFERLGERENATFLQMAAGQVRDLLGQSSSAWTAYLRATLAIQDNPSMRRAPLMLGYFARASLASGYIAASEIFEQAALKGGAAADPLFRIDALRALLRSSAAAGDMTTARAAYQQARDTCNTIADARVRTRYENDIRAACAEAGVIDETLADKALSEAIADSQRDGDKLRLSNFYYLRAKHRETARSGLALDDYASVVSSIQESRSGIRGTDQTRDWLRNTRGRLDRAIEFAMDARRPTLALAWVESSRLDRDVMMMSDASSIEAIRSTLKSDEVAVVYWSTEKELYIWSIAADGIQAYQREIPRAQLVAMSALLRNLLAAGRNADAQAALSVADDSLFAPLRGPLSRANKVLLVPDESLAGIPYAALFDSASRQYAAERFEIELFPSLDSILGRQAIGTQERFRAALVVADPAFDPALLPRLKRLRQSQADVNVVRQHLQSMEVISDEQATTERVLTAMERSSLVHFAGHSISDMAQPALSALVLAPDTRQHDSGLLYAAQIEDADLRNVRLVVLASCASLSGEAEGDGFAAVARSFVNAGVENVVGSLWDIRDGSSTEFMTYFYDALELGRSPAESVREAQLAMIRRGPGLSWAAFESIGGASREGTKINARTHA